MDGWWMVAAVGAVVFGWGLYLGVRHDSDRRLAEWWVSRTAEWGPATGPCSLIMSVAALVGYSVLAVLGHVLSRHLGASYWALLVSGPAMLAYAPFVLATAPVDLQGYHWWRSDLGAAGADAQEQRRIAWWAGPPSLLGIFAIFVTLETIFVE